MIRAPRMWSSQVSQSDCWHNPRPRMLKSGRFIFTLRPQLSGGGRPLAKDCQRGSNVSSKLLGSMKLRKRNGRGRRSKVSVNFWRPPRSMQRRSSSSLADHEPLALFFVQAKFLDRATSRIWFLKRKRPPTEAAYSCPVTFLKSESSCSGNSSGGSYCDLKILPICILMSLNGAAGRGTSSESTCGSRRRVIVGLATSAR